LRVVGSRLFFLAADSAHGGELWTSDGTPEGTVRLSDFPNPEPFPDSGSQKRQGLRALGGRVAFSAADELGRFEPWVSDGTIGGTRHLADVYPALVAPFFELSSEVVELGGRFFFVSGEESEVGTEPALWVSDLTPAGTRKVGPLADRAGRPASEVALLPLGARVLLFYSSPEESGFLSTDGASLVPGGRAGLGSTPVAWGARLAFRGEDSRLYATDGTEAGTVRLTYPNGSEVLNPALGDVLAGRLAFSTVT